MGKYARVFLDQARAWIGKNEIDGSHKEIIDIYNSYTPRARGYKVKYTDAWCATTLSAIAIKLGYTDIIPLECGCEEQIKLWKTRGQWVEDESVTPKIGWFIYYDWDDNGKGDCKGYTEHVGVVESVSGCMMIIIEGNKNDSVSRRAISVNSRYIRGYGVPNYDEEVYTGSDNVEGTIETDEEVIDIMRNLVRGDKGYGEIATLQRCLKDMGYYTGEVDRSFGPKTEEAVKKFQEAKKIKVNYPGTVGPKTWTVLLTKC